MEEHTLKIEFQAKEISPWALSHFLTRFTQYFSRLFFYDKIINYPSYSSLFLAHESTPIEQESLFLSESNERIVYAFKEQFFNTPTEKRWYGATEFADVNKVQEVHSTPLIARKNSINEDFFDKLNRLHRPLMKDEKSGETVLTTAGGNLFSIKSISLNSPLNIEFSGNILSNLLHEIRFGHNEDRRREESHQGNERRIEELHQIEVTKKRLELKKEYQALREISASSIVTPKVLSPETQKMQAVLEYQRNKTLAKIGTLANEYKVEEMHIDTIG